MAGTGLPLFPATARTVYEKPAGRSSRPSGSGDERPVADAVVVVAVVVVVVVVTARCGRGRGRRQRGGADAGGGQADERASVQVGVEGHCFLQGTEVDAGHPERWSVPHTLVRSGNRREARAVTSR